MLACYQDNYLVSRIPDRLIKTLKMEKRRKDFSFNVMKFYAIVLIKCLKEKNRGNAPKKTLSSTYWTKIFSLRYANYKRWLQRHDFIDVTHRDIYVTGGELFEEQRVESYKVGYRAKEYFVIEYPNEEDNEVEFKLGHIDNEIYVKNKLFIQSLGLKTAFITRDDYGYRLYHNLSSSYKSVLSNDDYVYYDAKASVPNIIREKFIKNGHQDDPFLRLFDGNFYENWAAATGIEERSDSAIKKNFNVIINGNKKDADPNQLQLIKDQFPYFFAKIRNRCFSQETIKMETDIILEDIFRNLPVDKALSIHDGFIVEKETENLVDNYLKYKEKSYGSLRLVKKIIETEEASIAV